MKKLTLEVTVIIPATADVESTAIIEDITDLLNYGDKDIPYVCERIKVVEGSAEDDHIAIDVPAVSDEGAISVDPVPVDAGPVIHAEKEEYWQAELPYDVPCSRNKEWVKPTMSITTLRRRLLGSGIKVHEHVCCERPYMVITDLDNNVIVDGCTPSIRTAQPTPGFMNKYRRINDVLQGGTLNIVTQGKNLAYVVPELKITPSI